MPVFESPEGESDGGYVVSDLKVMPFWFTERPGTCKKRGRKYVLMLDIVLNHTSLRMGDEGKGGR
jgi:amylosucrase